MTSAATLGVRRTEMFFRCWAAIAAVGATASITFWLFEPLLSSNSPLEWQRTAEMMLRGPAILMSIVSALTLACLTALLAVALSAQPWPNLTPALAAPSFYYAFYDHQLRLMETAVNAMSSRKEDALIIWSNEWFAQNANTIHATKVIGLAGSIVVFISLAILVRKSAKELPRKSEPVPP